MKKKMERLSGELFRPLTSAEQRRTFGGGTQTVTTIFETANPNPDTSRDGDHE